MDVQRAFGPTRKRPPHHGRSRTLPFSPAARREAKTARKYRYEGPSRLLVSRAPDRLGARGCNSSYLEMIQSRINMAFLPLPVELWECILRVLRKHSIYAWRKLAPRLARLSKTLRDATDAALLD